MFAAALLLVFALGYVNQRGSTCAVAAADQIVAERRFTRLAGFAVAAAASAVAIVALRFPPQEARMAGWAALGGGAISALGASLNGRCAMGTVAALSRGNLARIATLGGFFLGALLGHWARLMASVKFASPTGSHLQPSAIAVGATIVLAVCWYLARHESEPSPAWMAGIGVLNALLVTIIPHWTYTDRLAAIAGGEPANVAMLLACLIALLLGGAFAARLAGSWRLRSPGAMAWARAGLGGMLMGCGALLIPGGNDTMLLRGATFLLPHLLLAYGAFLTTLVLLRYLRLREILRNQPIQGET